MTATIHYETPDGTGSIERDEYHFRKEGWVTAYDNPDWEGTEGFIQIPRERVIRIQR